MTTVRAVRGTPASARADLLVVPVPEGEGERLPRGLSGAVARGLARRAREAAFRGRADEILVHHVDGQAVALLGLGSRADEPDTWRRIGARSRREAERQGSRRVAVYVGRWAERPDVVAALAEGAHLVGYRFDRYRREPPPSRVDGVVLLSETMPRPADVRPLLAEAELVTAKVAAARDLVNEPPSIGTPTFVAEHASKLAAGVKGLAVEVWDPKRIAKEGLAGLQAVARGSAEPSRFIRLHWAPCGARRRVALVGKGITFDSGGLSLKPSGSMETMKSDMAGAAGVLSAVAAAAALELPIDVTAYVSATENLPGATAQKPGDVIRYANGKTVEVLNTDAEGRLVLADLLVLASQAKPDVMIDLATLTGAQRVALGNLVGGVFGNDQPTIEALVAAGRRTGESVWPMPLVRDYRDDLKSGIADLKNIGGPTGGMIVAALFLEEFVSGVKWAHIDIAGPAFSDKDLVYGPRGATGFGVRLLVEYLRGLARA
ncbi:MAG: leucyl aminopeptidase [Candidatus Binatia bacterium]